MSIFLSVARLSLIISLRWPVHFDGLTATILTDAVTAAYPMKTIEMLLVNVQGPSRLVDSNL